ncbi:hypothetical protein KCU61_g360, partial [Aureobasidium melanogenum]
LFPHCRLKNPSLQETNEVKHVCFLSQSCGVWKREERHGRAAEGAGGALVTASLPLPFTTEALAGILLGAFAGLEVVDLTAFLAGSALSVSDSRGRFLVTIFDCELVLTPPKKLRGSEALDVGHGQMRFSEDLCLEVRALSVLCFLGRAAALEGNGASALTLEIALSFLEAVLAANLSEVKGFDLILLSLDAPGASLAEESRLSVAAGRTLGAVLGGSFLDVVLFFKDESSLTSPSSSSSELDTSSGSSSRSSSASATSRICQALSSFGILALSKALIALSIAKASPCLSAILGRRSNGKQVNESKSHALLSCLGVGIRRSRGGSFAPAYRCLSTQQLHRLAPMGTLLQVTYDLIIQPNQDTRPCHGGDQQQRGAFGKYPGLPSEMTSVD